VNESFDGKVALVTGAGSVLACRFTRVGDTTISERDVSHLMRAARALLGGAIPNPERLPKR
jgi:hypothetical protein